MLFILSGDEWYDLFHSMDIEFVVWDLHAESDDWSANNLYCMGKELPLRYSQESMF